MAVKQQEMQRTTKKTKTPVFNNSNLEIKDNLLPEANADIKLAYNAFINAKEELSEAVKEQEEEGKAASKYSERRYQAYRQIVEQAFKERETTEQQAIGSYRESVENAGKIYRDIVQTALDKCKLITDKAWDDSLEPLRTSPTGEINHPTGTWLKITDALSYTCKQTKTHTIRLFNRTKTYMKSKLGSVKTANAQSGRIE